MVMKPLTVQAPDGVAIAAQAGGNPAGPEIVFAHGFSQSHACWDGQVNDPVLAEEFRLVTYDLRGHGASDKPRDPDRYRDDAIWAGDLHAVIIATGLERPVIVGWSYAGRVVTDYLRVYGQDAVAGVVFVSAVTKSGREFGGPGYAHIKTMQADDPEVSAAASRAFVEACFARQPDADTFAKILESVMLSPPYARAGVLNRTRNDGDMLAQITTPALVVHGSEDSIVLPAMADFTASQIKGAQVSRYHGIGHSPFVEDAPRFNRELADFTRVACNGTFSPSAAVIN